MGQNMMKKVSVIIPVYNAEKFLVKCIESLVKQTLEEIELIFINDGSTDLSLQILKKYERNFPQKVIVYSKENGGQASARNYGIQKSNGKYIGFVDADDYVDTCMYEEMYKKACNEHSDYVECRYQYLKIDEKGLEQSIRPYGNVRPYNNQKEMFIDPLVSPWNKIYKSAILKEHGCFFTEGVIYEDTAFYTKVIPYLHTRSFVDKAYVYHYLWPGSTMNNKKYTRIGNIFPVLEDIISYYKENNFFGNYKMELEYFCVKILLCSSLKRIAQVNDRTIRNDLIKKTQEFIKIHFPNYRKNKYMQKEKIGLYMRWMNKVTIPIVVSTARICKKR